MQRVRAAVVSFFVMGALGTACASSEDDPAATSAPVDAGPSEASTIIVDSATNVPDTAPPKVCIANCQTDSECQTTCPSAPAGTINCCDTSSGVCYSSSSTSCGGVDAGVD